MKLTNLLIEIAFINWKRKYKCNKNYAVTLGTHQFDLFCTSTFLAKRYFDLNVTSTSLLRTKLYFSINNKSRFEKRSKYASRSRPGRSTENFEMMRARNFWVAAEKTRNLCLGTGLYLFLWILTYRYISGFPRENVT